MTSRSMEKAARHAPRPNKAVINACAFVVTLIVAGGFWANSMYTAAIEQAKQEYMPKHDEMARVMANRLDMAQCQNPQMEAANGLHSICEEARQFQMHKRDVDIQRHAQRVVNDQFVQMMTTFTIPLLSVVFILLSVVALTFFICRTCFCGRTILPM